MPISKHDKQALSDLFVHLGAPIVTALQTVESWSGDTEPMEKRAEKFAKLLSASVDFSTQITKKLQIRDSYTLENVRGRILRTVTPIISELYIAGGEIPSEEKINDLTNLFDVVLSFADSMSPVEDEKQTALHAALSIQAMSPVIDIVRQHSFGLSTEACMNAIARPLQDKTAWLATQIGAQDPVQSGVIAAVSDVFAACYKSAIDAGQAGNFNHEGTDALSAIWDDCEERLVLLLALTQGVGKNIGIDLTAPAPATSPKPAEATDKKPETAAPKQKTSPDSAQSKDDDSESDGKDENGDFNPMTFFGTNG